jgi:hypothetical protein
MRANCLRMSCVACDADRVVSLPPSNCAIAQEGPIDPCVDRVPRRGVATALLSRVGCSFRLPGMAG